MPLTRYEIKNEYGLADPELYRSADRDDPEALLEGVAMAGLVGVLRQLGDLSEFAAEIFHDLHEEVLSTAGRGHSLMVRVQQLEDEVPSIEKALLSQTNHSSFFSNTGTEWHSNMRLEQNFVARGDLPRFIMDSYEECRGPPRLFLLDKFDVGGAGACLKRYTDPSFFKVEAATNGVATVETLREKKTRKAKKRGSRCRNGETPEVVPTSHMKLHQLLLEERIENSYTDPARLIKLKKRQLSGSAIDSKTGKSYMEKFVETPSPEHKEVCQTSITLPRLTYTSENTSDSGVRVLEISTVSPVKTSSRKDRACSSPNSHEVVSKPLANGFTVEMADGELVKVSEPSPHEEEFEIEVEKLSAVSAEGKTDGSIFGFDADGVTSEVDNYMDALATVESELETDNEYRTKNNLPVLNAKRHGTDSDSKDEHLELQAPLSEPQSTGRFSTSDDGIKKGRSSFSYLDIPSILVENTTSDFDTVAEVSPSETCGADIVCVASNQLTVIKEPLGTKSGDPVMLDDTCIQEEDVHEDNILDLRGLSSIDLSSEPFYLDPEASLPMVSDSSAGPNERHEIEDKKTNVVDYAIVVHDVSSQTCDDSKKTSQSYAINKLDNGDLSNILEASAKESRVCAVNELFETQYMDSDSYTNLVGDGIDSTTTASTEVQCLPEVECDSHALVLLDGLPASSSHYSDINKAEDLDTEIDSVVPVVGVVDDLPYDVITAQNCVSEELLSKMDSPEAHSLVEQQLSEVVECVPHIEPVSVDADVTYVTEKSIFEEISGTVDKEEITLRTSSVDEVQENGVSRQLESSGLDDPGEKICSNFNDAVLEAVKDLKVLSAVNFNAIDDYNLSSTDKICSPSGDITSSQEPVCVFVEPYQKEMEWNEVGSPQCLTGLEKGVTKCGLEVAPEDLGMNPSNLGYSGPSSSETDSVQDLSVTEQNKNSLAVSDLTASSTHLKLSNMESEPKSSCQNHPVNNIEDDMSSSRRHLRELSKESLKLQSDQVEVESMKMDKSGYHSDKPLDHLAFQAGQHDEECLPTYEAHINSLNCPTEKVELLYHMVEGSCQQRESPDYINQEMYSDASLVSCQEDLASQHSTSKTSAQSGGQVVETTNLSLKPLESTLPSFMLLPEAPQLDSGEMPPLPPLPPVQWRMGRFQFASQVPQKELMEVDQDLFPLKQVSKDDDITQVESHTSQIWMEQPLNPLLPFEALVNEKSQQGSEHLLGNLAHPTCSLQLPTMVDVNIRHNDLALEGIQSSNPFLTVEATCNGRPGGNSLGLELETAQSSSNAFLPLTTTEYKSPGDDQDVSREVIQPLNQVALEKGLDAMEKKQSLLKSGGDQGNLSVTSIPPSTMVDQSQLLWMPEGEGAWVSNSYAMVPESEVEMPNGNLVNKLPRPRNPLIDAVAAHGKSKLRKVTERVRSEIEPKAEERDSLLEQIRTKSFNLKPAAVTRPSVQGPKTNLKVAAILEKANAIRQAWAGSDEDDEDSWSDS